VYAGGHMEISTKELRIQPDKIIEQVVNGQEITVTFRGKTLAKIVPLKQARSIVEKGDSTMF
jgi:prevent-host-death family protein